jgi:hypothetical protein
LEVAPVRRKKATGPRRKKLDKEALGKATTPKEVQNLKEEEESTTKDVQYIMNLAARGCQNKGRLGYFQFLVDPNSFSHTVENMFHFSFLIKDGRLGVTLGQDGIPYIYMREGGREEGRVEERGRGGKGGERERREGRREGEEGREGRGKRVRREGREERGRGGKGGRREGRGEEGRVGGERERSAGRREGEEGRGERG